MVTCLKPQTNLGPQMFTECLTGTSFLPTFTLQQDIYWSHWITDSGQQVLPFPVNGYYDKDFQFNSKIANALYVRCHGRCRIFKKWIHLKNGLQRDHGLVGESNKHIRLHTQEVRRYWDLEGLIESRQRALIQSWMGKAHCTGLSLERWVNGPFRKREHMR